MTEYKLKQLEYESDTWKRLLAFMIDENIHLKQRLGEVMQQKTSKLLLEEVENFQNRFLKEDHHIGLLRNQVADFDKLLVHEVFENERIASQLQRRIKKIRDNLSNAEVQFSKLKLAFNNYLLENS
jgi:hypothetical protein